MSRGHTEVKRKPETLTEKSFRISGYEKDVKDFEHDTKKNIDARIRFRRVPYYLKGRKEECQEKKDGITE